MSATWSRGSPFRGLQFFDIEHGPVFYGRSRAVDETIGLLRRRAEAAKPFVLVFGSSGVGKSSLVRAGVLPQLLKPGVIEGIGHWRYAIFRPSDGIRLLNPGNADTLKLPGFVRSYGLNRGLAKALMRPEAIGVECPTDKPNLWRDLDRDPEVTSKVVQAARSVGDRKSASRGNSCLPPIASNLGATERSRTDQPVLVDPGSVSLFPDRHPFVTS